MQPIYKPGFSVENKNKILSESDIKTVQEMYGMAKHVIVMEILNSNKAKVMIKNIEKGSKTKRVKIIYIQKPKHFGKNSEISEKSFKILLNKVADKNYAEFEVENIRVGDNA